MGDTRDTISVQEETYDRMTVSLYDKERGREKRNPPLMQIECQVMGLGGNSNTCTSYAYSHDEAFCYFASHLENARNKVKLDLQLPRKEVFMKSALERFVEIHNSRFC